mmetsp:Transcript_53769/g.114780  ORF Transcript_53769/g.114780 Transcript_53769/m.114780 type:complete len:508 (+) Transcript_53769:50-1573(+)
MSPVLPGVVPANTRVSKAKADPNGAPQDILSTESQSIVQKLEGSRRSSPATWSTSASKAALPETTSSTTARSLSRGAGAGSSKSVGAAPQAVPTVIFDLSTGTASARMAADRSASSPTSPASRAYFLWREHADPALLEYYGNLLRAEHKERRNLEAMLNEELASHSLTRKEMQQREHQFLAEKKQLQQRSRDQLYYVQSDHVTAYRELEQEFEALRDEHESLREKSKQQTLCQKSLLREVSALLLEREALKKEIHRLTNGASLSAASTPTQRGRRLSGGNPGATLTHLMANSRCSNRSTSQGNNSEVPHFVDIDSPTDPVVCQISQQQPHENLAGQPLSTRSQKQMAAMAPMVLSSSCVQGASLATTTQEPPKRCQPRQHQHANQQLHPQLHLVQQVQQQQQLQAEDMGGTVNSSSQGINRRLFQPGSRTSSDVATFEDRGCEIKTSAPRENTEHHNDRATPDAPNCITPRGPSMSQRKIEDEKISEYLRHMQGFPRRSRQERPAAT